MGGIPAGDGQDIRLTFDRVPEIYDRIRPSYPAELFDALFAVLPPDPSIVEVGPGTGQATVDLLDRGARVTAIEIGPDLASLLRAKFAGFEQLTVLNSSFEQAPVSAGSFDAVVCATMYHWISPTNQIERPLELLKPEGVLGVIDLIQVDADSDRGYFDRVQPIYEAFGQARTDWDPKTYATAQPKIADRVEASERFADVQVHRVPWDQTYSSSNYRELLMTFSGTQMLPVEKRDNMLDQLIAVVDNEYDGVVTRPLVATLTLARALH